MKQMAMAQQRVALHGDLPLMHASAAKPSGAKRPKLAADEQEALREVAIEAYRMQKKAKSGARGEFLPSQPPPRPAPHSNTTLQDWAHAYWHMAH